MLLLKTHIAFHVATGTSSKNWGSVCSKKVRYTSLIGLPGRKTGPICQPPTFPIQTFNENWCWKRSSSTLCRIFQPTHGYCENFLLQRVQKPLTQCNSWKQISRKKSRRICHTLKIFAFFPGTYSIISSTLSSTSAVFTVIGLPGSPFRFNLPISPRRWWILWKFFNEVYYYGLACNELQSASP